MKAVCTSGTSVLLIQIIKLPDSFDLPVNDLP